MVCLLQLVLNNFLQRLPHRFFQDIMYAPGCCYGLEAASGTALKRTWKVKTTIQTLAEVLNLRCRGSEHAVCRGKEATQTGFYCESVVKSVVNALVQHFSGETVAIDDEVEEEIPQHEPASSSWEAPRQTERLWMPEDVQIPIPMPSQSNSKVKSKGPKPVVGPSRNMHLLKV